MAEGVKTCKVCGDGFVVEADDRAFYDKIGILEPSMCPLCRARHRLAFRNERSFYKRDCGRCGKGMVSVYSPNKPFPVYCHDCWWSDDWNAADYGREYDPSRPFFDQFREVWEKVPKLGLIYVRAVNSEYINISADAKNCYMIVESSNNEDCIHCYWIQMCKNLIDVSFSHQTEFSYECDDCYNSNKLFYSKGCHDCRDSYFLLDCRDCSDCIGCVNLRSKRYHVFNKPVPKDEYERFRDEARLHSHSGVEELRKQFHGFVLSQPLKYAEIVNAPGSSGNYIKDAKNCRSCFHCYDAEDCKYGVHNWRGAKWCMDCDTSGRTAEFIYNSINTGMNASNCVSCSLCWMSTFMEYCCYCFNSNHCLGSVGIRKKDYCILNRQYSKEDYERVRGEIVEGMKERGEYGEFFPASLSPFGYNEACVWDQFPLEKDEALRLGFSWEDHPRGTFGKETVSWDDIPDSILDIKDRDITKEVFSCISCEKNYLVIPEELSFYKQMGVPLPRLCPDCRHVERFKARGSNRLWERGCMCGGGVSENGRYRNTKKHVHEDDHCPEIFETSFAPDGQETLYCKECYEAEAI